MAQVLTEAPAPGAFIINEEDGHFSREVITIVSGSDVVQPGTVLGKITASGKYEPSPATGSSGSETAVAINIYGCDATDADQEVVAIVRGASEVNKNCLFYDSTVNDDTKKGAKHTQLVAVGIVAR